jgi:mRNA interferase MazF
MSAGHKAQADITRALRSSTSAKWAQYRPEIEVDGTTTRVLVEQTMAVDPQRLGDFGGRLDAAEMGAVDDALRLVLALR